MQMKTLFSTLLIICTFFSLSYAQQPAAAPKEDSKKFLRPQRVRAAKDTSVIKAYRQPHAKKASAVKPASAVDTANAKVATPIVVAKKDTTAKKANKVFLLADTDSTLSAFYKGSFLQLSAGLMLNSSEGLAASLYDCKLFGINPKYQFPDNNLGNNYGAMLYSLFDKGVMIGLGGSYGIITNQGNTNGEAKLTNYGAQINIAKSVYNNHRIFVYPFVGVGFSRYNLALTNTKNEYDVKFDAFHPIKKGTTQDFIANYPYFDLGFGVKGALTRRINIGFEAGGYFSSITQGNWKNSNGDGVNDKESPGMNGFYAKLTLELVKFKFKASTPNYIIGVPDSAQVDSIKKAKVAKRALADSAKVQAKRAEINKQKEAKEKALKEKEEADFGNNSFLKDGKKRYPATKEERKRFNGNADYFNYRPDGKSPAVKDSTKAPTGVQPPPSAPEDKKKKKKKK
jgi:hypothetical protein